MSEFPVSTKAEFAIEEEASWDEGSFCPSRYTPSINTSHVMGYAVSLGDAVGGLSPVSDSG